MAPPLPKEKVKILEEQFKMYDYIPGEEVMHQLAKDTELTAEQIRSWFNRERGKRKRDEEKDELEKKIAKQDAEIRRLRDQIAALQVRNAELQRQLENQVSWDDILSFAGSSLIS